jgi:hypothetical protein
LLLVVDAAQALEVVGARWGLAGSAVSRRFNLLTVELRNDGDRPYSGPVSLHGGGAPLVVAVHLDAGRSRRVRFVPFLPERNQYQSWELRWGGGASSIDAPTMDAPRAVRLGGGLPQRGALPEVPADSLPGLPAAWEHVGAVVIGPGVELAADVRQAFDDWLRCGGRVVVADDAPPAWQTWARRGGVAELGTGRVALGAAPAAQISADAIDRLLPPPVWREGDDPLWESLDQRLSELVRPDLPWAVLFLVLIGFTLAVGPLGWLLLRRRHWAVTPLAVFGLSTVATLLILHYGRRGYGEADALDLVVHARPLAGERWALRAQGRLFSTVSRAWTLRYPAGAWRLGTDSGSSSGDEAVLPVDLFSGQVLAAGGTATLAMRPPRVRRAGGSLTIDCDRPITRAWLLRDGRLYELGVEGTSLRLGEGVQPIELSTLAHRNDYAETLYDVRTKGTPEERERAVFDLLAPMLALWAADQPAYQGINANNIKGIEGAAAAPSGWRLFAVAALPDAFAPAGAPRVRGRCLFDLPLDPP